jgi:beta-mannanase
LQNPQVRYNPSESVPKKEIPINVIFLWNPGNWPSDIDKKDPHGFYPGNEFVDWIGLDSYQRVTTANDGSIISADTFADDFDLFYGDFSGPKYGFKPLMVGENGAQAHDVNNVELQAPYLDGLLVDVMHGKYPQLKAYDYFDQLASSSGIDWVLDGYGGMAAFTSLAHSREFSAFPFHPWWPF